MDSDYLKLLQSPRVRSSTRNALLARMVPADPHYQPRYLSIEHFNRLRVVVQLLIPQNRSDELIDIAIVLDTRRATGKGDGWRYASMPPDAEALSMGLESLEKEALKKHDASFASLYAEQQTALLTDVQNGRFTWPGIDAARWFEELLTESTEIYVSHPSTLASMGYDGIVFPEKE